jgi:two-component system, cell cycle sensor histidine kinase and response regulator CckA
MKQPLHILMVEDSALDAELAVRHIEQAGHAVKWERVDDAAAFKAAMELQAWDVILCDHSMPGFSGLDALAILRGSGLDVPFIFVSGTMGEDAAVGAMQAGAQDYVVKGNFKRLVPAIERGLRDAQMRAQKIQAEQMLRLRTSALEAAANAVVIVQRDGRIQWVNPAFTSLTGYSAAEAIGQNPRLLQSGQHDRPFYANLWQTILAGRVWRGEMINRRKDGSLYPEDQTITPVRNARGEITHFIGIKQDVTERKRLEEQFLQAQKMEAVGHLASGVAHDFNNILTVILGYADLMEQELKPGDSTGPLVEEVRAAAERAVGLTKQLLIFSRKQKMQPVVLDPNEVLTGMQKMLQRIVDETIELTFTPGPAIGRVKADSGYLGQVVLNLVVNARDAMPNGGKLTIATSNCTLNENSTPTRTGQAAGDYVMLSVSDTGCGITDEVQARMFETFFTTKPEGKGTGLGLATCQTIVQQSGGHIEFDSEVGRGTTFRVYLPRADQPLEFADEPTRGGTLPRGTETLLVVEDEPSLRNLTARLLETQGYVVLRANSGQDGLRVAREHKGPPLRLVVTDVIMPEMGGTMMVERLAATYPDLKILYTSGYTDSGIEAQCQFNSNIAFLAKPYTPVRLTRKVRALLDNLPDTSFLGKPS